MLNRTIKLPVNKNNFFLFGPRQTGKTTLIKHEIGNHTSFQINLLYNDQFIKYKTNPSLLRNEIEFFMKENKKGILFIDEIQKLPVLLDEVHVLIENYKNRLTVILSGSSARKIRRVSTNLLGGRAWTYSLFPLTHVELGDNFSLDYALQYGTLPPLHGLKKNEKIKTLNAYTQTYLKEEIIVEALVRNLGAFNRFLEIAADSSGAIVNYTNIARETGVASKTIREYYQILEDTLIAIKLEPFYKSARKRIIMHPKYYLFDTGVINSICGRLEYTLKTKTSLYGVLFEHFIFLELYRLINYREKPWKIYYWRTSHGAEVDLVLEFPDKKIKAIEIKSAEYIDPKTLSGLKQFLNDHPKAKGYCVCKTERPYIKDDINFLPWSYFFSKELSII